MAPDDYEKWWMMLTRPPMRARRTARTAEAEGQNFMAFLGAVGGPQE